MGLQFEQSTPICLALAALGGALEVFSTAVLAYPDAQVREGRKEYPKLLLRLAVVINVVLQITASIVGNLLAPAFGPVSWVGPYFMAFQMLTNMVLFGWLLKLESFTKEMKVGTYVVLTSTILLPIAGPQPQEPDNPLELVIKPWAAGWSLFLLFGMMLSMVYIALGLAKRTEKFRYVVLLVARSTAFTLNLSSSKLFFMTPLEPAVLVPAIIIKIVSGAVMTAAIIVQSTTVEQSKFVPLNSTIIIIVNGVTGIVVWEDWKAVMSWVGYVCILVLLILGNYLLLGNDEVDFFMPDNVNLGREGLLRKYLDSEDILRHREHEESPAHDEAVTSSTAKVSNVGESDDDDVESPPFFEAFTSFPIDFCEKGVIDDDNLQITYLHKAVTSLSMNACKNEIADDDDIQSSSFFESVTSLSTHGSEEQVLNDDVQCPLQGGEVTSLSSNVSEEQIEVYDGDVHSPFYEAVTSLSIDSSEEQVLDDDNIQCPPQDNVVASFSFNALERELVDRKMRQPCRPQSIKSNKSW